MGLSTYTSYLIVSKDMTTSLNRTASQATVKRDSEYYQENIGKVTTVDEFLSDYRLYSYAMKAYGLEDMTYAKAFIRKILESDMTDSSSFANKLTDTRYKDFASAFNFTGGSKIAQSDAQTDALLDAYETSFTDETEAISTETKYYDTAIDRITTVDGLVNNDRLMSYALKSAGIYNENYSPTKLKQLFTSDMNDPASYANVEYVQKRATLAASNTDMQTVVDAITSRTSLLSANATIDAKLNATDSTLTAAERAELQATRAENATRIADYEATLTDKVGTTDTTELASIRTSYKSQISANTSKIASIDKTLALKEQFSFNTDGTLVNSTAQTADQKEDMEANYLQNVSSGPSTLLYTSNKAHYEDVIASATSVDDLVNDARVVSYIVTAYGLSSTTSASTLRSMLLSDPEDSESIAAVKGMQDFPLYFNFESDGSVTEGETAQSSTTITFTSSTGKDVTVNPLEDISARYKTSFLTDYETSIQNAMDNYEKRIDAVNSIDDLFETNADYWQENATTSDQYSTYKSQPELWEVALEAYGLDADTFSQTKVRRILESDLDDKNSYIYSLKNDKLIDFAEAFNFDSEGNADVPLQVQSQTVANDTALSYAAQKVRFLSGKDAEAAAAEASTEGEYYVQQMGRITTVDQLLSDDRLVTVMLEARGIDPESVTTADLKKMFLSDLSDSTSYVNTLENKQFAELVASFNFDSEGNITDDESILGTVQQRGDVLETVNRFVRQTLEEDQGNTSDGLRLALYFQRKAGEITSAYDFISDSALAEFFKTAFSMSSYFSNMDVDKQKEIITKRVDLDKLGDADYVEKLIQRYTALYDSENSSSATSAALTLLTS